MIVISVPSMVKIEHFWLVFAQSQPKKMCPAAISSSEMWFQNRKKRSKKQTETYDKEYNMDREKNGW